MIIYFVWTIILIVHRSSVVDETMALAKPTAYTSSPDEMQANPIRYGGAGDKGHTLAQQEDIDDDI